MPECPHPFGKLRQSTSLPERYVQCGLCNEVFGYDIVVAYNRPGAPARMVELIWAMAGYRDKDTRPLRDCLAPGVSIPTGPKLKVSTEDKDATWKSK
jgi:hypothetical protein